MSIFGSGSKFGGQISALGAKGLSAGKQGFADYMSMEPIGLLTDPANNFWAKKLGLDGAQGEYLQQDAPPELSGMPDMQKLPDLESAAYDRMRRQQDFSNRDETNGRLAEYGQGSMSLNDIMKYNSNLTGEQRNQFSDDLATNALTGSRFATDQVASNPLLSKAFGNMDAENTRIGGMRDRFDQEDQDLSKRGYSLQPEDHEAYGQGSGNLARIFGQQEQSLAQSLADRGLAAAPSGAAAQSFSGLHGNKNEQLAGLQRQISDDRVKMNEQRRSNVQNTMMGLNQQRQAGLSDLSKQQQGAIQNQFGRNLSGVENRQGQQRFVQGAEVDRNHQMQDMVQNNNAMNFNRWSGQNAANLNRYNAGNNAKAQTFASKQANKGKTLLDALGRGLLGATEQAPSMALGAGMSYATGSPAPMMQALQGSQRSYAADYGGTTRQQRWQDRDYQS